MMTKVTFSWIGLIAVLIPFANIMGTRGDNINSHSYSYPYNFRTGDYHDGDY